jgi:regulation of enolase protein 1 (concanavalin A-like superfamily)
VQAGRWDEAVEALEAIVALQPSDDVTDRLAQARLKQQVTELRNDVLALAETGDWAAVLAADAKLAKLDPETSDPEGLATKARATLLEAELGGLYTDGVKQLDEHDWTGAEATFRGLLDRRAGYRDVDELVALAQRRGRPTEEKHVQLGPVHPDSATRGGGSQPAHVRTVLASSSDAVGNRHRRVRLSPSRVGLLLLAAVLLAAGLVLTGLALSRIRPEAPSSHPTAAPVTSTTPTSPVCGFVEEFDGATLAEAWQRTRPDATVKLAAGTAELAAPDGADIYEDHLKAPMLLREVTGDFVLETDVTTSPHQFYQGAGLVLRSGPENYVRLERGFVFLSGIGFEYKDGGDHIRVRSPRRGPEKVQTDAKRVVLQLTRKGQTISARWRPFNEPGFTELGRITVRFPDTIRVGISVLNRAQSGAKPTSFRARFEHVALSC